MLKVSAPGKLFLFGEYGVLAGGICVVTAVDRRVTAQRNTEATGYEILGADFTDALALPEAVVAAGPRAGLSSANLSADVRAVYDVETGEKLGLGSSAASAVALSAAYLLESEPARHSSDKRSQNDQFDRKTIFTHAFRAHRALQKGRGSGADIAASTFGRTIAYRLRAPAPGFEDLLADSSESMTPDVSTDDADIMSGLRLPEGLRIEPIWLGRPASSTSFMRGCERAISERPDAMAAALAETSNIAEQALQSLLDSARGQQTNAGEPAIVECVHRADRALERLGDLIAAPIITDAHRRLRDWAAPLGIAVKPSGAGGGDFSLAVAPHTADWARFLADLPSPARHLPLTIDAPGVAF